MIPLLFSAAPIITTPLGASSALAAASTIGSIIGKTTALLSSTNAVVSNQAVNSRIYSKIITEAIASIATARVQSIEQVIGKATNMPSSKALASNQAIISVVFEKVVSELIASTAKARNSSVIDIRGIVTHAIASIATASSEPVTSEIVTPADIDEMVMAIYQALPMLKEVWQFMGLDKNNPLTVTPSSQQTGSIVTTIEGDGENISKVTRH